VGFCEASPLGAIPFPPQRPFSPAERPSQAISRPLLPTARHPVSRLQLRRDIDQIWKNCQEFNGVSSWLGEHAETLRQFTQKKFVQASIPDAAAILYTGGGGASPARQRRPGLPSGGPRLPAAPVHAPKLPPSRLAASAGSTSGADDVEMTLGQCRALLKPFLLMPTAVPFLAPVDPVQLNIPDYPLVVTHPMDLGEMTPPLYRPPILAATTTGALPTQSRLPPSPLSLSIHTLPPPLRARPSPPARCTSLSRRGGRRPTFNPFRLSPLFKPARSFST
jgi:hypothetical protein